MDVSKLKFKQICPRCKKSCSLNHKTCPACFIDMEYFSETNKKGDMLGN